MEYVRLIEVVQKGEDFIPTGMEVLLGIDCPLFQDPAWKNILEDRVGTVGPRLFANILEVVNSVEDDNVTGSS
jgi:hypothetical protein